MTLSVKESRRSFLRMILGSSVYAFLFPSATMLVFAGTSETNALAAVLANFFGNKASARVVGTEYLRCNPTERGVELLINRILPSTVGGLRAQFITAGQMQRREILLNQKREDFEYGRTVKVRGWILCETEVRLCALAALL